MEQEPDRFSPVNKQRHAGWAPLGSMGENEQDNKAAEPDSRAQAASMLANSEPAPVDMPRFARRMAEIIMRALRHSYRKSRGPR
jgi:hypothetical protein